MEAPAAATTFATLVGLLRSFRREKGIREALGHRQFIEWLQYHRHEDDLDKPVGLGLLTVEYHSQGTPPYHITRNAIRFLKAVDGKRAN
jgi:hypothetical protein